LPRVKKNPSTPALIVMFGIVLSVNHQSSLGSLFLLMPDKLSHYWWSPRLPFNFLISAVAIGFSVVLVERALTARLWKRRTDDALLARLALIAVGFLWIYLVFRSVDVYLQVAAANATGNAATFLGGARHLKLLLVEMGAGVLLPALLLTVPAVRTSPVLRPLAAMFVVLGGLLNRLNVGVLGMTMEGSYVPTIIEIVVAVGVVATILLLYTLGVKLLPVFEADVPHAPAGPRQEAATA